MPFVQAYFIGIALLIGLWPFSDGQAFEFFPSNEDILTYRTSWNPLSNGPILLTAVDINPKGQAHSQYFVFSEIGHQMFGNTFTTHRSDSPFHLTSVEPLLTLGYGLTDHLEFDAAFTGVYFNSSQATPAGNRTSTSAVGLGDTFLYVKYRPVIQNPNSWRPSITIYNQLGLPTSDWIGTPPIPGGFSPLGKLPVTSFGSLTLTEGLLFRKNIKPFRFSGGVFYTYAVPGHSGETTIYQGDIVNTRFITEYIINEARGFGLNLEIVTVHGIPGRLDGHPVSVNPSSFNLFGVEPAVQYKFGSIVAAAGVLFTIAGQNDIAAFYPNISLYYYWDKHGAGVMR
ncbi:MAG: hypothetical protein OJF50_000694 [Nitrospira sp.]|jgi:hypothetical protein|nr:hypothetical protein [Nitrospira sp.]